MATPPSPPPSPSCPSRASAWRPRSRRRRSRSASPRRPARSVARCACRASAPARRPPPSVIKRVGRRPSSTRPCATRSPQLVLRGDRRRRDRPGRRARPRSRRAARPRRAAHVLDRDRRPAGGQARRVQGSRGRQRDPEVADEAIDAEIESLRERSGQLETVGRAAAEGDFVVMDYRGTIDGRPSPAARDATRWSSSAPAPRPRLRGSARRRDRGGERTVTVSFPDDYGAQEARRPGGRVHGDRQGGQGEGAAGGRRRLRRRGGLRHVAELRPTSRAAGEAEERASTPSSARRCSTPGRQRCHRGARAS